MTNTYAEALRVAQDLERWGPATSDTLGLGPAQALSRGATLLRKLGEVTTFQEQQRLSLHGHIEELTQQRQALWDSLKAEAIERARLVSERERARNWVGELESHVAELQALLEEARTELRRLQVAIDEDPRNLISPGPDPDGFPKTIQENPATETPPGFALEYRDIGPFGFVPVLVPQST